MNETETTTGRPVVVTTAHKGVFFGYLDGAVDGDTVRLTRARNCVYWSADMRGFMGLAVTGPGDGCRIGPAADIELRDITSIVEATPDAAERWEAAPW